MSSHRVPLRGSSSLTMREEKREAQSERRKKARRPLTYDDRLAIERGLSRGDTISWIARTIGRAPKVVREEVRRNWTADPSGHLVVQNRNIFLIIDELGYVPLDQDGARLLFQVVSRSTAL